MPHVTRTQFGEVHSLGLLPTDPADYVPVFIIGIILTIFLLLEERKIEQLNPVTLRIADQLR